LIIFNILVIYLADFLLFGNSGEKANPLSAKDIRLILPSGDFPDRRLSSRQQQQQEQRGSVNDPAGSQPQKMYIKFVS